jgi:hypothetical protein
MQSRDFSRKSIPADSFACPDTPLIGPCRMKGAPGEGWDALFPLN